MCDHSEQAMGLLESKTDTLARRLDRTWMYQFLLAIMGLAFMLSPETARALAVGTPFKDVPERFSVIVIPALLVYTFITFGYLLGQFLRVRAVHDKRVAGHFGSFFQPDDMWSVFGKQTLFEPMFRLSEKKAGWRDVLPFMVIMVIDLLVVVLNHAVLFAMVARFAPSRLCAVALPAMGVLLTGCYVQFYGSQRSRLIKVTTVILYFVSLAGVVLTLWTGILVPGTPYLIACL